MDLWAQIVLPVVTAAVGWFGNAWKYRSDRAQKEAELDQKDDELAQTRQRDAGERLRAQEERELELIDKARDLLNNGSDDDKQAARFYLMGLIRVQENRTQLVEEILDNFSKKEFGLPVAQIRAADKQDDDYLVLMDDTVPSIGEVVAELTAGENGGTDAAGAAANADASDPGAGRAHG